jgi:hypothetical protein
MAIPPTSDCSVDIGNPASFTNGGTAITDLSGNGKNFTLNNLSYTFDPTVGALTLPGGTIAFGDNASLFGYGTNALSILLWVKLVSTSQLGVVYFGDNVAAGAGARIWWWLNGSYSNYDNAQAVCLQDNVFYDSQWHLLAYTRPASALVQDQKFFIDGVLFPNTQFYNPLVPINTGTGSAEIHPAFNFGELTFATMKIYTADLNSTDLTSIYNSEKSRFGILPPVTGLSNGRRFGQGFPQ